MKTHISRLLIAATLLLGLAGVVRADTPPLTLYGAFTGGGGQLSAGGYTLVGAVGQPLAGMMQVSGYRLTSGVIASGATPPEVQRRVYLPLVSQ